MDPKYISDYSRRLSVVVFVTVVIVWLLSLRPFICMILHILHFCPLLNIFLSPNSRSLQTPGVLNHECLHNHVLYIHVSQRTFFISFQAQTVLHLAKLKITTLLLCFLFDVF